MAFPSTCFTWTWTTSSSSTTAGGIWAGDQALIQVAQQLQDQVRREDLLARLGGDEFVLMVRGVPEAHILQLAKRLRQAVQSLPLQVGAEVIHLTCSIGVASLLSLSAETSVQSFLEAADQALYQAKVQGGNREVLL
jgi:diguanylate cyclase (GGDEF)-like protein